MSACSILFRYYTSKRASECNCGVKCTVLSEQDCIVDRLLSCLFVLFSAVCLHCPVALQLCRTCRVVRALMKAGQTLLFSSFSISAAAVLSCLPLCGLSLLVSTAAFFLSTAHALRRPQRCSSSRADVPFPFTGRFKFRTASPLHFGLAALHHFPVSHTHPHYHAILRRASSSANELHRTTPEQESRATGGKYCCS